VVEYPPAVGRYTFGFGSGKAEEVEGAMRHAWFFSPALS
jgi:hypothetical protein